MHVNGRKLFISGSIECFTLSSEPEFTQDEVDKILNDPPVYEHGGREYTVPVVAIAGGDEIPESITYDGLLIGGLQERLDHANKVAGKLGVGSVVNLCKNGCLA